MKPILFSDLMVRAILEGRKTQTRRVLRVQPRDIAPMKVHNMWMIHKDSGAGQIIGCNYGRIGDQLWVREAWGLVSPENMSPEEWGDMARPWTLHPESNDEDGVARAIYRADGDYPTKWRPSIHMPRWASRITLTILSIRAERLQDITKDDIRAEGIVETEPDHYWLAPLDGVPDYPWTRADLAYAALWNHVNGDRCPWDSNPWVWVIGFAVGTVTEKGA